ncbi:class C beta-lactamase-related serine hydrolase [Kribbella pittospori]|uniref:Class C beta-lactamase-related serine hydrolase n=1 Tax=Kribbella pittospori TaxID=722689 RepID=A0A4R0K6K8_9ACTN|nr:class C beta-lactamase-related serine hydrolase [Kribbella pittospori]
MDAGGLTDLLDRLEERSIECHSIVVVRHGQVVAEGWWAPYSADRPHLLYSMTKSFVGIAVGLAIDDGRLALGDRVVDVLADHVPQPMPEWAGQLTVHHLLSMSTGHTEDVLEDAWALEPDDLVRGLLRIVPEEPVGSRHAYNNPTTFVLARMVERVTGRTVPDLLEQRLFGPLGIRGAVWERVGSGATFGFHGLYLTTEAVAAFGELLLRGGRWHDRQLVSREWVELATRRQIETQQFEDGSRAADWLHGYGYQFWRSRHGYRADGAMGQFCLVLPESDVVVAITAATTDMQVLLDAVWDCLLPSLDRRGNESSDQRLATRLRALALPMISGRHRPDAEVRAIVDESVLPPGSSIAVQPCAGGWTLRIEAEGTTFDVAVGHDEWRESSPLGRPIVAAGGWHDETFVADLYVITSPSRVRVRIESGRASTTWNIPPLVGPNLLHQLRGALITRPDRS